MRACPSLDPPVPKPGVTFSIYLGPTYFPPLHACAFLHFLFLLGGFLFLSCILDTHALHTAALFVVFDFAFLMLFAHTCPFFLLLCGILFYFYARFGTIQTWDRLGTWA